MSSEAPEIRLIVLNGTSSSGKTTVAGALLERLPGPWLSISGDNVLAMSPAREAFSPDQWHRFWVGVYQAIAALGRSGNRAVVDLVTMKALWLVDLADALDGVEALFVGVRCPLHVAEKRERARATASNPLERRDEGIARRQFELVHAHGVYDVEVDTAAMPPSECADAVIARVRSGPPTAFAALRSTTPNDAAPAGELAAAPDDGRGP